MSKVSCPACIANTYSSHSLYVSRGTGDWRWCKDRWTGLTLHQPTQVAHPRQAAIFALGHPTRSGTPLGGPGRGPGARGGCVRTVCVPDRDKLQGQSTYPRRDRNCRVLALQRDLANSIFVSGEGTAQNEATAGRRKPGMPDNVGLRAGSRPVKPLVMIVPGHGVKRVE